MSQATSLERAETVPTGHIPVRTCVGCKRRDTKDGLIRLVVVDCVVEVDEAGTKPGRGAYVHPTRQCLDLLVRKRDLRRHFRCIGSVRFGELAGELVKPQTLKFGSDEMSAR